MENLKSILVIWGAQEYFIHQPEMEKPSEFRGWQRSPSGNIIEIVPDAQGGLFSEALNLWFRWENQPHTHVRLLRPYLPDGTPITTSLEEQQWKSSFRLQAEAVAEAAEARAAEEAQRRRELEAELERLRSHQNSL